MSREEDLIRSTAAAIAATVQEVPPLRLSTATDSPRTVGRHARRSRRPHPRGWLVPAAAAAAVLAIALSLVLIRDIPNGRVAPPTRPVPAVDGVPAYYAGLAKTSDAQTSPEQIVVGDTVTDMIAIANDHVQAEVWIGVNDGLPRMIHVQYPTDPAKSRYEIQFSDWHLNQPTKDADFTSAQAMKAPRIQFARPDAPAPAKP